MVEWGRILWRLSCNIVRVNTVINIVRVNIETVNIVKFRKVMFNIDGEVGPLPLTSLM